MPEQPEKWPRGQAWTLMHAHEAGQIARITCGHCHITRHYRPNELREVIGNVTIEEVREKVRCQACGKREWMAAELFHAYGQELVTIKFRRLKEIRWERRVIWRDEP